MGYAQTNSSSAIKIPETVATSASDTVNQVIQATSIEISTISFIKSGGPSEIQTISYRGSTAQQVQAFWEDVPLNSPTLGQADYSLIPMQLFQSPSVDDLSLGFSASLNLAHQTDSTDFAHASAQYGSFEFQSLAVNGSISGKRKQTFGFHFIGQSAQNDYRYNEGEESFNRQNAEQRSLNGLVSYQKGLKKGALTAKVWGLSSNRNLPSPLFIPNKDENLVDEQYRGLVRYQHRSKLNAETPFSIQFAQVYQKQVYTNPSIELTSLNEVVSSHLTSHYQFSRWLKSGIKYQFKLKYRADFNQVFNANYAKDLTIDFIDYKRLRQSLRWKSSTVIAEAGMHYSSSFNQILPAGLLQFKWEGEQLKVSMSSQAQIRWPSLNDRFWQPGGNPGLQPERALKFQATMGIDHAKLGEIAIEPYYRRVQNYILWQPTEFGFWQPESVGQTFHWGADLYWNYTKRCNLLQWQQQILLGYNVSRAEGSDFQLPYVPHWLFKWSQTLILKAFYAFTQTQINSAVVTNTSANNSLNGFIDLNIGVGATWKLKNKRALKFECSVKNALNQPIFVIENRPLPGIHYLASVQYRWHD